jgi:phenylpropionate dioxygenase-like ring-hydroxylating dioxygenase large terminal subunit
MGRLMREYWLPCLLSSELPSPGCAPIRVMLLCERLVAFRDSRGRVGLLEERCPHRGTSLFFGRNEGSGLRCAYHGWKFDTAGTCLETPNETAENSLAAKVRARAYACRERGGIVWAYLGPRPVPPPLPALEPNMDDSCGAADASLVENNWLQSLEGDVDLPHLPFVHAGNYEEILSVLDVKAAASTEPAKSTPPFHVEVADTPGGFAFGASVPVPAADLPSGSPPATLWSVGHFLFPFYANLPYGPLGSYWMVARVPMDDFNTMTFGMWQRGVPRPPLELMLGIAPTFLPPTADGLGRFRLTRQRANDFKLDREAGRNGGLGVSGQAVQDNAVTGSMGPIADRSGEHLGKSDIAIIHLRLRLLAALDALEKGSIPAVDRPGAYRVKHGIFQVAGKAAWHEELRRLGGAGQLGQL